MALKIKTLAFGVITNINTTVLYTADNTTGQKKAAIVGSVILCYTHATAVTVKLKVNSTTTNATLAQIAPTTSMQGGTATGRLTVTQKLTLGPGDKIECELSAAPSGTNAFAYIISGFERDVPG